MGSVYYGSFFGKKHPTIGLLNVGGEDEKGDKLSKSTFALLKADKKLNFIGNVEGGISLMERRMSSSRMDLSATWS